MLQITIYDTTLGSFLKDAAGNWYDFKIMKCINPIVPEGVDPTLIKLSEFQPFKESQLIKSKTINFEIEI